MPMSKIATNEHCHMVGQSVLDFKWMDPIADLNQLTLILAEGVFMYLMEVNV